VVSLLRREVVNLLRRQVVSLNRREVVSLTVFSKRIIEMAKKYPAIGYRISIEGLSVKNDQLRGREGGFDKGLRTLLELRRMKIKDIGFGITVSNNNSEDMLWLYELSRNLKMQFATATFHNSFYFHKYDNVVTNKDIVCADFEDLINRLMKENDPKSWFRAFFNLGLINYINDGRRMLPCEAGTENFFIDPYGEVLPCNGMEARYWYETMGNLTHAKDFMEIWNSEQASIVREKVANCPKSCWMIGSASPVMKKYIKKVTPWVIKNKLASILGKNVDTTNIPFYCVGNNDKQGLR
jgi:radical SAM protein with 4Fe4S-binding SPASM domain